MLSNVKYQETKEFLLRITPPSTLISEFATWFYQRYYVNLLNFDFTLTNRLDLKYDLLIIIENQTGKIKETELNLEDRVNIKGKFIELSIKYNFANIQNLGDIEQVSVCYFQYESQIRLIKQTLDEVTAYLKNKYSEILRLEQYRNTIAVIYHSDAQSVENEKRGINKMIINDCLSIIKKYDDVNCFTKPFSGMFIGQETLNKYGGDLHYYMR